MDDPAPDRAHPDCVEHPGRHSLTVTGDLDVGSGPVLVSRAAGVVDAAATDTLVLDFTGVGLMDASGIRALLEIRRLADRRDTALRLHRVHPRVAWVLEVTKLSDVLGIERSDAA